VLLVQVFVGQVDKALQQFFPRIAECIEARTHHALRGDTGEFFHGLVPHQDLLILGQGAHAHGQLLQRLAMVAAQGIKLGGKAGEAGVVILQPALDEMDVFGDVVFATGFIGQKRLYHVLGHAGAHQARQVRLNAVTQTA